MFNNAYVEEVYESEHVCTATKRLSVILDAKYLKLDLHKDMENQCQQLKMTQHMNCQNYHINLKSCLMENLSPRKYIFSIFWVKSGCESNILAIIPSTKGKWGNFKKGGWALSPIRSPWGRKWSRMGIPVLCAT